VAGWALWVWPGCWVGLGCAGGGVVLRCVATDDCRPKLRAPPRRRASASSDTKLPATSAPITARIPIRLAHCIESFSEALARGSDMGEFPLKTVHWER